MLRFPPKKIMVPMDLSDVALTGWKLAKNMGVKESALLFFEVHSKVQHYDMASESLDLKHIWDKNPEKVSEAFRFIGDHQNWMWRNLSECVLNYGSERT